eukprot:TRINITY_DN40804_c0_g1_i1.p1 TRINITY_DN40804_c0_g1~~TRINITY_DN40804_c0_g1_i1.p1  ORF type:complete len:196 (-),score=36.59 TRINITY_DN40804_c0_g1_i1:281-868(-)
MADNGNMEGNVVGNADVEAAAVEVEQPAPLNRMNTEKLNAIKKDVKMSMLKSLLGLINVALNAAAAFAYPENVEKCEMRLGLLSWQGFFITQMIACLTILFLVNLTLYASWIVAKAAKYGDRAKAQQGLKLTMLIACTMLFVFLFVFIWMIIGVILYWQTPDEGPCHVFKRWWIGIFCGGLLMNSLMPRKKKMQT